MKNIFKLIKTDIENYQFTKEQIEKHQNDLEFKRYDIFVNWWKELCIIISLTKDEIEIVQNTKTNDDLEDAFFYQHLNKINNYITNKMLLGDIFIPYVQKIPNSYSYKLKYKILWNFISIKNSVKALLISIPTIITLILLYVL